MVKTAEKKEEEEKYAEDIDAALNLITLSRNLNAQDFQAAQGVVEEEEEAKKMRLASSKRRNLDADEFAKSSAKMPKAGFVHGKNQNGSLKKHNVLDDEEEGEEFKKMRSKRRNLDDESRTPRARIGGRSNQSGSLKKHIVLDDEEEEIMRSRSKRRHLGVENEAKSGTPQARIAARSNHTSGYLKEHNVLDDEEEEIMRLRSKRRYLGGENEAKSRTPQSQMAGRSSNSVSEKLPKSRIGYSIDGKKLPKPEFGYSIDGKKLSRYPQIEKILHIIGKCSDPFEKKLLKTDLEIDQDKLSFHRYGVQRAILSVLNEDEKRRLAAKKGKGIRVNTYNEFGNCYNMIFKTYRKTFYKLCNGWKKLLRDHQLKENEDCYVAVWAFRHVETDALCFALMLKR